MGGAAKNLLSISLSSNLFTISCFSASKRFSLHKLQKPTKVFLGFRPLCTATASTSAPTDSSGPEEALQPMKHSILLERLRLRHLKEAAKPTTSEANEKSVSFGSADKGSEDMVNMSHKKKKLVMRFEELGLSEEVMGTLGEMGIEVPTEIQSIGIPAVLEGKSVVLGSHTGSGKTLAYMLPIVQVHLKKISPFFLYWNTFVWVIGS